MERSSEHSERVRCYASGGHRAESSGDVAKAMRLNPRRYIGNALHKVAAKILRRPGINGIWMDVGAHLGETTLSLALQNPGLTVYAFEPNLRVAASVIGRAPNFIVLPMAVAETDGCSELHINSFEEASSLLAMDESSRRSWKGGEALRDESVLIVPTIRLDTFMDSMAIGRVDFLKVDTQGSDLAVL